MGELAKPGELLEVDVPRSIWAKGTRPVRGTLFRFALGSTCFLVALSIPTVGPRIALVVLGAAVLFFLNPMVDRRLEGIGRRIASASRPEASRWLVALGQQRFIVLFAPAAWVALQRGKLNLRLGNWRAAAKAFSECAALAGEPKAPTLVAAQAQALTLAGERKEARALFKGLAEQHQLSPRDHLYYGIAQLEEARALGASENHLEKAREALGDHPQLLAALALMHARAERATVALQLLTAVEGDHAPEDELVAELIKRARKLVRPVLAEQQRRQRKAKPTSHEPGLAGAANVAQGAEDGKSRRKDKRKERREKRRAKQEQRGQQAGKSSRRQPDSVPPQASPEHGGPKSSDSTTAAGPAPIAATATSAAPAPIVAPGPIVAPASGAPAPGAPAPAAPAPAAPAPIAATAPPAAAPATPAEQGPASASQPAATAPSIPAPPPIPTVATPASASRPFAPPKVPSLPVTRAPPVLAPANPTLPKGGLKGGVDPTGWDELLGTPSPKPPGPAKDA